MIHKVSEALACEYESAAEGAYRPGHHGSDLDKAHHMIFWHVTRLETEVHVNSVLKYFLHCIANWKSF
ncbi:hypothetical protein BRADI_3g18517v3 [Brachypodium distachyon]|uniref:Uncharacterized protein n=1 Tax=Brachypodium distachyon TaxID=15368 RepID=A0A2K2CY08_BRADI|nr:hypothetical protein BRADI_3g18517v3 [Brachypodium distachyon]